jgi:hypothetical protein
MYQEAMIVYTAKSIYSNFTLTKWSDLLIVVIHAFSYLFDHCVFCPSIYGFSLAVWYLQTLLTKSTNCIDRKRERIFFFVDRCLSFCPFSFGHYIVCPSMLNLLWQVSARNGLHLPFNMEYVTNTKMILTGWYG